MVAKTPTLALVAHDGKKASLISFAKQHADVLRRFRLVAMGTTGKMLQDQLGLEVTRYMSGPLEGDVQIASRIVEEEIYGVIFFVDPLDKHPHEPDIQTLLRTCNVHNVPLATNAATARFVVDSHAVKEGLAPLAGEELRSCLADCLRPTPLWISLKKPTALAR